MAEVPDNTAVIGTQTFATAIVTDVCIAGPSHQAQYARVNVLGLF